MKVLTRAFTIFVVSSILMFGCDASETSTPTLVPPRPLTPTVVPPTPPTLKVVPTPITFSEKIDVGGYELQIRCVGQGTPAVIVDSGLGISAIGSGHWRVVTSEIAKTTQICLYDRAGVGSSDPAPGQYQSGRTSQDVAKDLHTLLANANVSAPYILVGHSIGGYNVRFYATEYPNEVAGILLVDSAHPDQWSKFSAVLPPESQPATDRFSNPESMDVIASAAQVRATKRLGDLPLIVLTRAPGASIPNLSPELSAKVDQIWQDLQNDLARLSSNSTHIIATYAGHNIPVDEPQLVIDAILKLIADAKK
jgi:pimeloyl-ACP methyl ester carboxylesterase